MRTTNAGPLQRHPEVSCEALEVPRRALELTRELLMRQAVRDGIDALGLRERRNQLLRTDGRRGIHLVVQDAALLLAAGASRGEVMHLPAFLAQLIEELCDAEQAGGDRVALELAHMRADAEEDLLQGPALVEVESLAALKERAKRLRAEVATGKALLIELDRRIRRLQDTDDAAFARAS